MKYKVKYRDRTFIIFADSNESMMTKINKIYDNCVKDASINLSSSQKAELQRYAKKYEYDMEDVMDGLNSRIKRQRMTLEQAIEDIESDMASGALSILDAKIKDFDETSYLDELYKLVAESEKLYMSRRRLIEFYLKYPEKKDNWLNDAKVIQWIKQARQFRDKWNKIIKILIDKFNFNNIYMYRPGDNYMYNPGDTDKDVWFTLLPQKQHIRYLKNNIKSKT